jgi:hypothetical protein
VTLLDQLRAPKATLNFQSIGISGRRDLAFGVGLDGSPNGFDQNRDVARWHSPRTARIVLVAERDIYVAFGDYVGAAGVYGKCPDQW